MMYRVWSAISIMPSRLRLIELRLVGVHAADDLAGQDLRLPALLGPHAQRVEDGDAPAARTSAWSDEWTSSSAEQPLDHLHGRPDLGGLERNVGDAVDLDAGRNLDPQRGIAGQGQETPRRGADEGRHLRLQAIQENIRTQIDTQRFLSFLQGAHTCSLPGGP